MLKQQAVELQESVKAQEESQRKLQDAQARAQNAKAHEESQDMLRASLFDLATGPAGDLGATTGSAEDPSRGSVSIT